MKILDFLFFILYFLVNSFILVNGFLVLVEGKLELVGIASILLGIIDGGIKFCLILAYIDYHPEHLLHSWYHACTPFLPLTISLFILYVFTLFVECLDCGTDMFLALLFHCHVTYLFARPSIREWVR
jgi:hypothetical protein